MSLEQPEGAAGILGVGKAEEAGCGVGIPKGQVGANQELGQLVQKEKNGRQLQQVKIQEDGPLPKPNTALPLRTRHPAIPTIFVGINLSGWICPDNTRWFRLCWLLFSI